MTDTEPATLNLAHFSDSHIGYAAYRALSPSGANQRMVDIGTAFVNAIDDIITHDPPLVVHSGDIGERPDLSNRQLLFMKNHLERLAGERRDGTRRQVVVIAGNHDMPSSKRETCFLELFRGIPGIHVVTDDYRTLTFDSTKDGCPAELDDVAVHCISHDTLKDLAHDERFDEVQPSSGKTNVLVAHGVAGGSGLFKRVMGREYSIPTDVLSRDWDYVALGHWHKQGPVNLSSAGYDSETGQGKVWYAGSTENCGFGDLLDNGKKRGYLQVAVTRGQMPAVKRVNLDIRVMHRLPVLEISDDQAGEVTVEEIEAELLYRIAEGRKEGVIDGAVVGQIVKGVSRDKWGLVDMKKVRAATAGAIHYEVTVEPVRIVASETEEESVAGAAGIISALHEEAEKLMPTDEEARKAVVVAATKLLEQHMEDALLSPDGSDSDADAASSSSGSPQDAAARSGDMQTSNENGKAA